MSRHFLGTVVLSCSCVSASVPVSTSVSAIIASVSVNEKSPVPANSVSVPVSKESLVSATVASVVMEAESAEDKENNDCQALYLTQMIGGHPLYCCVVCQYHTNLTGNIQRHVRTHTGERPFPCPECGQRFRRKEHVQRHLIVHIAQKF
ncbi:unnamed protein product [Larinioides sclopetarius]|uniref:C2H2-type domain-containing protein n=1 Tax=Larinioides sclopetarius TaxID=280406 RepID=A0AAV1ZUK3_9ARAC